MTTASNRSSPNRAAPMDSLWSEADERGVSEKALIVDLEVFEGPLDLLLHLARHQNRAC
jgi:segregation and condensation protein A